MTVHFTDDEVRLMRAALERWGLNAQVGQAVEELAELIVALQKHVNRSPSPETIDGVLDELADVEMMLAQMRVAFGIDDAAFRESIERKFGKLRSYLEEEQS